MWLVTPDIWHVTQGGGEHSLKISDPQLLRFGIDSVLKIPNKSNTDLINESVTKVFIEQPQLHRFG